MTFKKVLIVNRSRGSVLSLQRLKFMRMSSKTKQKSKHSNEQVVVRSLDRQITTQDLDCLREAFALFDVDRTEEITTEELGKVGRGLIRRKILSDCEKKIERCLSKGVEEARLQTFWERTGIDVKECGQNQPWLRGNRLWRIYWIACQSWPVRG